MTTGLPSSVAVVFLPVAIPPFDTFKSGTDPIVRALVHVIVAAMIVPTPTWSAMRRAARTSYARTLPDAVPA